MASPEVTMRAWLGSLVLVVGCATSTTPSGSDASLADASSSDATTPPADASTACVVPEPTGPDMVALDTGRARGTASAAAWSYRGLPFAAPPVGALRFRAPAPPACWEGIREATDFGSVCPQLDGDGTVVGNEDCLTLNVWTPRERPSESMPVLVFMHGGANNQGGATVGAGGGVMVYDGSSLAARGVVVVTLQYRLGALGFLAHSALDAESDSGTSGNWGLRDQIAALAWVQRNIAAFGGDPARVLLFGESAGALDTCLLVAAPQAAGLFSRALMQSGGCPATPRAIADESATRLVDGLDCGEDVAACLRDATLAAIFAAVPPSPDGLTRPEFGPIVDGDLLARAPIETIEMGAHAQVPIVLGTNAHETSRMLPPPSAIATESDYVTAARAFLASQGVVGASADSVLALYPVDDYESPHATLVALSTDVRWTCPTRRILRALTAAQDAPVHRYFFTQGLDPMRAPMASRAGAYHGLELFYVFDALTLGGYRPTDADLALRDAVQGYWTRFAASGDPNGEGAVAWPRYATDGDAYLELGTPVRAGDGVRSAQCDALEALGGS